MNPGCDLIIPVLCVEKGETLKDVKVTADKMTVVAIQVKCLSKNLSGASRAVLCSEKIKRVDTCHDLGSKHPYFCGLLEMRSSVKKTQVYKASELKKFRAKPHPKQVSFLVAGLRPGDIVAGTSLQKTVLNEAFEKLNVAFYDPKSNPENEKLGGEAKSSAVAALKENLELYY